MLVFLHLLHQRICEAGVDVCPYIDDLVVAVVIADKTHRIVHHHFLHLGITLIDVFLFLLRDDDVAEVEGKTSTECHAVAEVLDVVEELRRTRHATRLDDLADDATKRLLRDNLIDVADLLRHKLIEQHAANGGVLLQHLYGVAILVDIIDEDADGGVKSHFPLVVSDLCLFGP